MSKKMHETLQELSDRTRTFFKGEEMLRDQEKLCTTLETDLKETKVEAKTYELEMESLQTRMFHADNRTKQLTQANEGLTAIVSTLKKHEASREKELITAREATEKMSDALELAEFEVQKCETTTLFSMQSNIDSLDLRNAKLEKELKDTNDTCEEDKKRYRMALVRFERQIESLDKQNRMYRAEIRALIATESRLRFEYSDTFDQNDQIKNEMKVLRSQLTNFDMHKADHKNFLDERNTEIHQLQ